MDQRARRLTRRLVAVSLAAGMLLTVTVGATGAGAHPGFEEHEEASGIGVQVNTPDELAGFREAIQWDGTAAVDDQTADLAYAGTGCTPANYATADVAGKIVLLDAVQGQELFDTCPVATFKQKMELAEQNGAIGLVQVSDTDELGPANAVDSGIPGLEVTNTDGTPIRDAVVAGTPVNVTLTSTHEPVELPAERLSDVPCEDGHADVFECDGVDLLSFVPHAEFAGATDVRQALGGAVSDLWGWTDEDSGDEYVIIGKTNGVGFFRVTDPTHPVYLGELPNQALLHQQWHDIKVYDNHAFMVSESNPYGMVVFDLTRLRGVDAPQTWTQDGFYPLPPAAHNLEINTDTGFAYIVGGNAALVVPDQCLSGLHMVDINTPTQPTFAGCYAEEGGPGTLGRTVGPPVDELPLAAYVHDAQCVVYDGPDERYTDREICFNAAENKVVIADVTDKLNPVTLGVTDYPNVGYTHQGWLTEDHAYLLVNDELDEMTFDINTRTVVLDVTDLRNPKVHVEHSHDTRSITHNNYVVGDLVYQSNYTSGLRVLDTTPLYDAANPRLEEIAFFDTFPTHGDPTFEGTWSNYPFFESGTIAVSGIDEGLFLVRLADDVTDPGDPLVDVTCSNCPLEIRAGESGTANLTVTNHGDADDSYDITLEGLPERWSASIDPHDVTVAPGESAEVAVTVGMPRREKAGTFAFTVIATSASDAEVTDSAQVEVTVRKGEPTQTGPPASAGASAGADDQPSPGQARTAGGAVADFRATPANSSGVPATGVAIALLALVTALHLSWRIAERRAR